MLPDNNHIIFTDEEKAAGIRIYQNAEEQELDRLREALKRTPDEKFAFLMELMRLQQLMQESKMV